MFSGYTTSPEQLGTLRNMCVASATSAFGIATECSFDNRLLASMCTWAAAACVMQAGIVYARTQKD